jgi:Uma2 family endonuclease
MHGVAMATAIKLSATDHGREMTLEEFLTRDYASGFHYELIDGRLYVSPLPDLPEDILEEWLYRKLIRYSEIRPEIINYVTNKARVFVPGQPRVTAPESDLAAYRDFPIGRPFRTLRWQNVSPILTVEVLAIDDPDKDFVGNVELYLQVPSIKEYWILDPREDAERPSMHVYRRHGKRWQKSEIHFGARFLTRLLPGFEPILDPRT